MQSYTVQCLMICPFNTTNLVPIGPNGGMYFVADRVPYIQIGYNGQTLPRHWDALARREGANCDEDNDDDDEEAHGLIRPVAHIEPPSVVSKHYL